MNQQEKVALLVKAAKNYRAADQALGDVCADTLDPIACTVYALKGQHLNQLPQESQSAAHWLSETVRLHKVLVQEFGMDSDDVRALWFPILNW